MDAERPSGPPPGACEGSLRRLRLEQIPLYQFHTPDPKVPLDDSIGALVELKEQGKVRHIGLSNVSERQLRQAQRLTPIVSIQNRYNLVDRKSDGLVDLCEQEQMAFIPWAPIQDLDKLEVVGRVAESHGATPTQVVARLASRPLAGDACRSPEPVRSPTSRRTSPRPGCA